MRIAAASSLALIFVLGAMGFAWSHERELRQEAEEARASALAEKERADRERVNAEHAARDAEETLVFLQRTISKVHPVLGSGPEVKMRDVLEMAISDLENALPASAEVQATIRNTLGEAFAAVDEHEHALEQLGRALELRSEALGAEHYETLITQDNLAALYLQLDRLNEAEALDLGASFADFLENQGRLEEAEIMIRETLEGAEASLGPDDSLTIICCSIHASILEDLGRYAEAEPIARDVVAAKTKLYGPEHDETLISKNVLALILERLQRYPEARALLRETWEASVRLFGPDHSGTLVYLDNLARQEQLAGNLDEAERLMTDSLERQIRLYGEKRQGSLVATNNLALLKLDRKKPAEALLLFQRCGEGLKVVLPPDHWMHAAARKNMGDAYLDLQQLDEAEQCFLEAERGLSAALGPQHDRTRGAVLSLIDLYERKKNPEEKARWQLRAAGN